MVKKRILINIILFSTILFSKEPLSLEKVFKETFSQNVTIGQKDISLSNSQRNALQNQAKAKIDSSKIRFYIVKRSHKDVGYGVLLVQKIRTKRAAILYIVDAHEKIKNIEIIAFKEPSEYKPYRSWLDSFIGKSMSDNLKSGEGISTISGATMSARAISNAARIALAIVSQEKN